MHQMNTPHRAFNSRRSSWTSNTGSHRSSRSPSPAPSQSNASYVAPQPVARPKTSSAGHGVHVSVRVRPYQQNEQEYGADPYEAPCFGVQDNSVDVNDRLFKFDTVLPQHTNQQDVFETIGVPTMESFLNGFNSTIMAYGQTSAGKTYTMDGYGSHKLQYNNSNDDTHVGQIPRCLQYLFDELNMRSRDVVGFQWAVNCSFVEIYNEKVRDLMSGKEVQLQMNKHEEVIAAGQTKNPVFQMDDALQVFIRGTSARQTASTNMNDHSSRSHSVVTVELKTNEQGVLGEVIKKKAKLHFVDLAGSECVKTSGVDGLRQQEAANINKSLLALSRLIMDIVGSARLKKAPNRSLYRGSSLTQYLRDSFGGTSKQYLIANVSPSVHNQTETISTLNFASQARKLPNKPVTNVSKTKEAGTESLLAALTQLLVSKHVTVHQIQHTLGMAELLVQQNNHMQSIILTQQRRLQELELEKEEDPELKERMKEELQEWNDLENSNTSQTNDMQYNEEDWQRSSINHTNNQRPFSLDGQFHEFHNNHTNSQNTNPTTTSIRPRQFLRNLTSNDM